MKLHDFVHKVNEDSVKLRTLGKALVVSAPAATIKEAKKPVVQISSDVDEQKREYARQQLEQSSHHMHNKMATDIKNHN